MAKKNLCLLVVEMPTTKQIKKKEERMNYFRVSFPSSSSYKVRKGFGRFIT